MQQQSLVRLQQLQLICQQRWLKSSEVHHILNSLPEGIVIVQCLPSKPQSGQFFVLVGDVKRGWKQDGYTYLPRKIGNGMREDVERLKVQGRQVKTIQIYIIQQVICQYSYIIPSQLDQPGNTKIIMYRRIYKLIGQELKYYFVHYLNPEQGANRSESVINNNFYYLKNILSDNLHTESQESTFNSFQHAQQNQSNDVFFVSEVDSLFQNFVIDSRQEDYQNDNQQIDSWIVSSDNQIDPLIKSNQSPVTGNQQFSSEKIEEDDIMKDRIFELERRINMLENGRNPSTPLNQFNAFGLVMEEQISKIRIIDYSPEWDFIDGGSKMVLCYQPIIDIQQGYIVFGEKWCEAACIQPGVLKCFSNLFYSIQYKTVPQNEEGCVKISVLQKGSRIDDIHDRPCIFEYRKQQKAKKKKEKTRTNPISDDKNYQGEFKVRVIEKLSGLSNFLSQFQMGQDQSNPQQQCEQILGTDEQKNQQFFTTMFDALMKIADTQDVPVDQLCKFLNEADEHGFSLIHYLTALGYQSTIKLLLKYSIDLNQFGVDNLTPLQIAVLMNKENMISFLIQQGAIDLQFTDQLSKVDQLFQMENVYKNKNIIDLLIRGVTLCDSIQSGSSFTEHKSWNEQEGQEDSNYLNLEELCDQIFIEHLEQEQNDQQKQSDDQGSSNPQDIKLQHIMQQQKQRAGTHKYLRNHSKQRVGLLEQTQEQGPFSPDVPYDNYQGHIKVIQKNVRAWLLRRQYLDMKYATQVLQNYIRNKIARKHINPDCKQRIKDTLRNWLNLKNI